MNHNSTRSNSHNADLNLCETFVVVVVVVSLVVTTTITTSFRVRSTTSNDVAAYSCNNLFVVAFSRSAPSLIFRRHI